jgi:hypothetical protein
MRSRSSSALPTEESLEFLAGIGLWDEIEDEAEYVDSLNRLGRFISENFSMEEVFKATTTTSCLADNNCPLPPSG